MIPSKELSTETKNYLESVLNGVQSSEEDYDLSGYSPNTLITFLESLGAERGDIETNGWDVDFWIPVSYFGSSFMLSGSWYYGTCILTKG